MAHPTSSAVPRDRADRLAAAGLALTIGIVTVGVAGQLVDYGLDLHVAALDSSGDRGLLGAAAEVALVAAALAAWAMLAQVRSVGAALVALPVLLTALVFVDAVPVAGLTLVTLLVVARRLPAQSRALLHAALVLLVTAFLIHSGGDTALDALGATGDGWAYQLKSVVKHGAEAGGWMLVAVALAAGRRSR
jgi:hypothetical protein